MIDSIKQYLRNWEEAPSPKPVNDSIFLEEFTKWAKTLDKDHWSFTGCNGYCGNTAVVNEYPSFVPAAGEVFEFAYSKNSVKVFAGYHNGFWTPEYINLKDAEARSLLKVLEDKFMEWGGFNE